MLAAGRGAGDRSVAGCRSVAVTCPSQACVSSLPAVSGCFLTNIFLGLFKIAGWGRLGQLVLSPCVVLYQMLC